MKSIKGLFAALTICFLASCSKMSDGTSVWAAGLWILPWVTGLSSLFFFWKADKASKSNSTQDVGGHRIDNTGNVPFHKTGWFVFGVILFLATIAIVWAVNSDK